MKAGQNNSKIKGTIYKVTSPSGKVYIGQTKKSFESRKARHIREANNPNSNTYNRKFAKAIRKYRDQLIWEILHSNIESQQQLDELEVYLIEATQSYKYGYNSNMGGAGNIGYQHSNRSKTKMSNNHADFSGTNNPMYGKSVWQGRRHTEQTREKMRNARLRYLAKSI